MASHKSTSIKIHFTSSFQSFLLISKLTGPDGKAMTAFDIKPQLSGRSAAWMWHRARHEHVLNVIALKIDSKTGRELGGDQDQGNVCLLIWVGSQEINFPCKPEESVVAWRSPKEQYSTVQYCAKVLSIKFLCLDHFQRNLWGFFVWWSAAHWSLIKKRHIFSHFPNRNIKKWDFCTVICKIK